MDKERLKEQWLKEERAAHIQGWDFSHIQGRYEEENDLPWSYRAVIEQYLESRYRLLDLDTGGGEFLLSLRHPYSNTSATEAYPPNVRLCEKTLCPLGVDFHRADASEDLPFEDEAFDIVINRHGSFCVSELHRVVKRGGIFITEQVGAENDRALVELLLPGTELPFPEMRLKLVSKAGLYLPAVVYSCAAHSALRRNGIKTESRLKFRDSPINGGGYCRFHIIEYSLSPVFCSVCSPEISKPSL